jgi:intracellular sulfur oxidation DsrE/DsrF family protein
MLKNLLIPMVFGFLFIGTAYSSNSEDDVANIVTLTQRPSGVVFEIASGDVNSLKWAIPKIKGYIARIREKFPDLDMAVVTHGKEQFSLQSDKKKQYQQVHSLVESLDKDENIPVHVCGTYASWQGITPEDFPAYVDVAPEGPAQINNYKELGYILVKLKKPG